MGLGISSGILVDYPFPAEWLRRVGIAFWGVASILFVLFTVMTLLRLILFFSAFEKSLIHPTQSMFWGCMPMGLGSIIADTIGIFGDKAVWACYIMWWVDFALSIACAWLVIFSRFIHHDRKRPANLDAVILLPVVSLVVCSTTGSVLVEHLPSDWRPHMIVLTAVIWGNGELLAFLFTAVFTWRLLCNGMPAREAIISCFLPVGPLGQGAYGYLVNAVNLEDYLNIRDPALARAPVFKYIGSAVAMHMVGLATFWMVTAIAACLYFRPRVFGIAWWGLSFPLGTYSLATRQLGAVLDIEGFKVLSALVGAAVVLVSFALTLASVYAAVIKDDAFKGLEAEIEMYLPKSDKLDYLKRSNV